MMAVSELSVVCSGFAWEGLIMNRLGNGIGRVVECGIMWGIGGNVTGLLVSLTSMSDPEDESLS